MKVKSYDPPKENGIVVDLEDGRKGWLPKEEWSWDPSDWDNVRRKTSGHNLHLK
jgi:hypothetical protein